METLLGTFLLYTDNTLVRYPSVLQCIRDIPSNLLNKLANSIRNLLVHTTVLLHGIGACETRTAELLLGGLETLVEVVTVISTTGVAGIVGIVHDEEGEAWDWWNVGTVGGTSILGFETGKKKGQHKSL